MGQTEIESCLNNVEAIFSQMQGTTRLMAELIYATGLRIYECMTLRVKDIVVV